MTISWPVALIAITVVAAFTYFLTTVSTGGMRHDVEMTNASRAEDYRKIADAFAGLAAELKTGQEAMAADIAQMREKIDDVERMMREVG